MPPRGLSTLLVVNLRWRRWTPRGRCFQADFIGSLLEDKQNGKVRLGLFGALLPRCTEDVCTSTSAAFTVRGPAGLHVAPTSPRLDGSQQACCYSATF